MLQHIVPELSRADMQEIVDLQRKEYHLIGTQKSIPGLTLYEYDLTTGDIKRAVLKKEMFLTVDGSVNTVKKAHTRDLCLYVQALNPNNAMKKVLKLLKRNNVRKELFKQQNNG